MSVLTTLAELAKLRGRPLSAASSRATGQMLDALGRVPPSDPNHGAAVDIIGSVAMRIVGDAESMLTAVKSGSGGLGRAADDRRIIKAAVTFSLQEMTALATVFAGAREWSTLYNYVCDLIRQLLAMPH